MKIIAKGLFVAFATRAGGKAWNRVQQVGKHRPVMAKPSEQQDGHEEKGDQRDGHHFRGREFFRGGSSQAQSPATPKAKK